MNLLERLPQEDKELLRKYCAAYGTNGYVSVCDTDYFLRFWAENKLPLYRAFGENFILKKQVKFTKSSDELEQEMKDAIQYGSDIICQFRRKYFLAIDYFECLTRCWLEDFVCGWDALVNNKYVGPTIVIPKEKTRDGRELVIQTGCKLVKMLGKIAKALGCEEGYEEFRLAHSLVLNQKTLQGTLCLSIHPMDYVTMSDNNSDWDSCMQWVNDSGDYRLGTIEMMNSPHVIVAYLEGSTPWNIYNVGKWNDKHWRQLFIVDPDLVLGNRQYPYDNNELQGTAIQWVRELVQKIPGWGPYAETASNIVNHSYNVINGDRQIYFSIDTKYMYNDVYGERLAYTSDMSNIESQFHCNFSGLAVCVSCGEIVHANVDTSEVVCFDCGGYWICDHCGDTHSTEDASYTVDEDQVVCQYCWDHEVQTCELCEEPSLD